MWLRVLRGEEDWGLQVLLCREEILGLQCVLGHFVLLEQTLHRLVALWRTSRCSPQFWGLGSARSRCKKVPCLVKLHPQKEQGTTPDLLEELGSQTAVRNLFQKHGGEALTTYAALNTSTLPASELGEGKLKLEPHS